MNAEQSTEEAAPWPKAGDVLFQSGGDARHTACLNFGSHGFDLYATGYKDAADALAENVLDTQRHADIRVYPIAFLYRHYLELRLKELIVAGHELLDQAPDSNLHHELEPLWRSCRDILSQVSQGGDEDVLDRVEICIQQFQILDPKAQSFRYPFTTRGAATLSGVRHIDIRNLYDVMGRISALLEAASLCISHHLGHKRCREAELANFHWQGIM